MPAPRAHFRRCLAATISACCLSGMMVCAQEAEQADQAEEKSVQLSFFSYPAQQQLKALHLKTGEESQIKIQAPNQYISNPLELTLMETWSLGVMDHQFDGGAKFVPVASCKSLQSDRQIVVVGYPIDKEKDDFSMHVLDGSADHFAFGSYLFLNLTDIDIAAQIEDEKVQIKPGEHAVISSKLLGDSGNIQAKIFTSKDGKDKPLVDSRWPAYKDVRSLIILYQGAKDRILMYNVQEQSPRDDGE